MSNIFQKQRSILLLVSSMLLASSSMFPATAEAVYCSNCSTFYQQMAQYAQEVNTALNTAHQLQTQMEMYNDMVVQARSLKDRRFSSLGSDMQRISDIFDTAQSIGRGVSSVDARFRRQYPGYQSYVSSQGKASDVMPNRYENWSRTGFDNARTAMVAAGINTSSIKNEDHTLDQMVTRSQNAQGRMQAIQVGNEIAVQNVQQLQKLRDLISTQITLQGNYMAQQQDRASMDDAYRMQRRSGVIVNTGRNREF